MELIQPYTSAISWMTFFCGAKSFTSAVPGILKSLSLDFLYSNFVTCP